MNLLSNYKIAFRVEQRIKKHNGSIRKAKRDIENELEESLVLWNKYSSDCLGFAVKCDQLMLQYIKDKYKI